MQLLMEEIWISAMLLWLLIYLYSGHIKARKELKELKKEIQRKKNNLRKV